jgi:O-methyltransferase
MPLPLASIRRWGPVRAAVERFPGSAARLHAFITRHTPLVPVAILESRYEQALERLLRDAPDGTVGDYLEFGVYRGDSMLCMQRASVSVGLAEMRLIGFDSFEGMPATDDAEDDATRSGGGLSYRPGALRSSYDDTVKAMTRQNADWRRIELVKGWYDETLTPTVRDRIGVRRAGLIMIDCVFYSSTMAALRFCEPLIEAEAIVVLDDWDAGVEVAADEDAAGERRAFETFMAENPTLEAEPIDSYLHEEDDPPSAAMIMLVRRVRQTS